MRFDPLPPALIAHMQQQRAQVAALVASAFPTVPVQWPLLPSTLQRVVDAELIDHDDCDGWEALGSHSVTVWHSVYRNLHGPK